MKLFIGHLIGFAMATVFCFVLMGGFVLFFPLIGAFLTWSLEPLTFDLPMTMFIIRCMFLLSVFLGVCFTSSRQGRLLAYELARE